MTDRPINLKAWQVRAALDGRLSAIAVPLKPQPVSDLDSFGRLFWKHPRMPGGFTPDTVNDYEYNPMTPHAPGDRLWCREAWAHDAPDLDTCRSRHEDVMASGFGYGPYYMANNDWFNNATLKKRPSIHMPRWASRLRFVVQSVRVMRVQDVSEADAETTGVKMDDFVRGRQRHFFSHRAALASTWNATHGPASWDANPWIAFSTVTVHQCNIDAMEKEAA